MTTSLLPDGPMNQPQQDDTGIEARHLFAALRAASRRETAPSRAARLEALDKIKQIVSRNEARIIFTISQDFGNRSRHETQLMEIGAVLDAIAYAKKHLHRWMRAERRPTAMTFRPAKSWIRYEPLGVIGIISPWNYPLALALQPLVDALAAGNRVLLKPSEATPTFSALLKELVAEHFAPEQVAVVLGDAEVAAAVAALPFDHLVFTGSTATGRKVAQAAAANLTPVTLELGGKSPAIVCADYPLEKAAESIALGKFLNAGQTCIAPDYALVPASQTREFAEAVIAKARKSYPTLAGNGDYTSIISPRHLARLNEALAEARAAGAVVWTHGEASEATAGSGRIAPTVVIGAPAGCALMREEIFGPVLPIVPYESLEGALTELRHGERPLALYCFSNDEAIRRKVLDETISGGVTLNGTILHVAQHALPFGGIGASGIGAYHGHDGFRRFSHARAVHKVGAFSAFEKMGPPWGRLAGFVFAMQKKWG